MVPQADQDAEEEKERQAPASEPAEAELRAEVTAQRLVHVAVRPTIPRGAGHAHESKLGKRPDRHAKPAGTTETSS